MSMSSEPAAKLLKSNAGEKVAISTDSTSTDEISGLATSTSSKSNGESTNCPFLHTINRSALDFDFEKTCSVTLSKSNVYACLVCGSFFQVRLVLKMVCLIFL